MTRSLMIYGQGSLRCHPFLQREIEIAQDADRETGGGGFRRGGVAACRLHRDDVAAGARPVLGFGRLSGAPVDGPTARHFRQIKRLSAASALASEAAIVTLGGALKRREMLSARLGDALSELYSPAATLKRFEDTGRPSGGPAARPPCGQDQPARGRERALEELVDDFPNLRHAAALPGRR